MKQAPPFSNMLLMEAKKISYSGTLGTLRLYLRLIRLPLVGPALITGVYGALSANPLVSPIEISKICLVLLCGHILAFTLNDYMDMDVDRFEPDAEDRPLLSGRIRPETALAISIAAALLAIILSLAFFPRIEPTVYILTGLASAIIYNVKGKRIPWLGDYIVALTVFFGVLYGGVAASGHLTSFTVLAALILTPDFLFMNAIIGSLKDIQSDKAAGIPSVAILCRVDPKGFIKLTDPIMIYIFSIEFLQLAVRILPVLLGYVTWKYLILLAIGFPFIVGMTAKFAGKFDVHKMKRLAVGMHVSWILTFYILIDAVGYFTPLFMYAVMLASMFLHFYFFLKRELF